jgi:hypothetical protein
MYNKLKKEGDKLHNEEISQMYINYNKTMDQSIEKDIAKRISEGHSNFNVFYKKNPKLDYDTFFTKYSEEPYNKPIMIRLCEKFPEPDFKCSNKHVHYSTHDFFNPDSPDVNYYSVDIKWGEEKDDCKCVLF